VADGMECVSAVKPPVHSAEPGLLSRPQHRSSHGFPKDISVKIQICGLSALDELLFLAGYIISPGYHELYG
jgi:hypothetical protein